MWGVAAGVYGLVLAFAALTQPIGRRQVVLAGCVAYALVAFGTATLTASFWVNLLVPGALLLVGYWFSGWFFHGPQPWLEQWLLTTDRSVGAHRWRDRIPRVFRELLEGSYASVYVVVGGAAIYASLAGIDAVTAYWALVLPSELVCYATLPWLRSRPPRVLESAAHRDHVSGAAPPPTKAPYLQRLNIAILDTASVQANTIPSGHVAGAVAAALGVMPVAPTLGVWLLVVAALIAIAAVAGRYHYVLDCVAGVAVAVVAWSLI